MPSESELRAQAVEDLKNLKEWPWKRDPKFEYEMGVTILLGATSHYFSFLVNVFGDRLAPDFKETYTTLQTMLSSPSFGRKLNKAEFYCNVAVAEWAHRMRNEFDPESSMGSGLYRHEVRPDPRCRGCSSRPVCGPLSSSNTTRRCGRWTPKMTSSFREVERRRLDHLSLRPERSRSPSQR
jgi:hypothetical protein